MNQYTEKEKIEEKKSKAGESGAAAGDGADANKGETGTEKHIGSEAEDGEEEGEEEADESLSQIEEAKEIPLVKKKTMPMGGLKGVVDAMKKQIDAEKLDSGRSG